MDHKDGSKTDFILCTACYTVELYAVPNAGGSQYICVVRQPDDHDVCPFIESETGRNCLLYKGILTQCYCFVNLCTGVPERFSDQSSAGE